MNKNHICLQIEKDFQIKLKDAASKMQLSQSAFLRLAAVQLISQLEGGVHEKL